MPNDVYRIAISEGGKIFKVSAIYLLSDGSFKMDVPYCTESSMMFVKHSFSRDQYAKTEIDTEQEEGPPFSAKRKAQLSIHASGFVQFSGSGILSGIDTVTGEAKGIALNSCPLATPVMTGPTCSALIWGPSTGYVEARGKIKNGIVVDGQRVPTRTVSSHDATPNAYLIEVFVFPLDAAAMANFRTDTYGGEYCFMRFNNYLHAKNGIIELKLRVIRLKTISSYLGLNICRIFSPFAASFAHGFALNSPTQFKGQTVVALVGLSPKELLPDYFGPARSLDFD